MNVLQCELVFRVFDPNRGLEETVEHYSSLEAVFYRIITLPDNYLPDRLLLHGVDGKGNPRTIVLELVSITTGQPPPIP